MRCIRGLVVTVAFASLIIAGCRSGGDEPSVDDPESTPGTQYPAEIQTIHATPTPTLVSLPIVSDLEPRAGIAEQPLSELASSICVVDSSSDGVNYGTAPGPTVTPVPTSDARNDEDPELRRRYLSRARSISDNLFAWSEVLAYLWAIDLNPNQQAAALMTMETRLVELCNASRFLDPPESLYGIHSSLQEVVRSRHAWSVLAIDHLGSSGTAQSEFITEGQAATLASVEQLRSKLTEAGSEHDSEYSGVEFVDFGIVLELPAGWYVLGTERNPVISAPFAMQLADPSGFGPPNWGVGVALRVRRFRNSEQISSEQAADRFVGFVSVLGDLTERSLGQLFGRDAVFSHVTDKGHSWDFVVITTVVGEYTFVVDYGCPGDREEWCVALGDVAGSIVFATE